jgi:hypothetical protein
MFPNRCVSTMHEGEASPELFNRNHIPPARSCHHSLREPESQLRLRKSEFRAYGVNCTHLFRSDLVSWYLKLEFNKAQA